MIDLEPALVMSCDVVKGRRYREGYYTSIYRAALAYVPERGVMLDVGTHLGNSSIAMAAACVGRGIQVHTVDPLYKTGEWHFPDANNSNGYTFHASLEAFNQRIGRCGLGEIITLHPKTSEELLKEWTLPLNFVLIDGAHTYNMVLQDCKWLDKIVHGGFALFDDWIEPVERAVRHFIADRPEWQIIHESTRPPKGWVCITTLVKS